MKTNMQCKCANGWVPVFETSGGSKKPSAHPSRYLRGSSRNYPRIETPPFYMDLYEIASVVSGLAI
jgi:hypothetical protein